MPSSGLTRSWYATIAALAMAALVGQIALVIEHYRSIVNFFSYFTVESNILVLAMSALIVIIPARNGRTWGLLRLAALTGITVTGVVYGTMIAPYVHPTGDLAFMAWPATWLAYTMIRGGVSHPGYLRQDGTRSRYPYGFLDVEQLGSTT